MNMCISSEPFMLYMVVKFVVYADSSQASVCLLSPLFSKALSSRNFLQTPLIKDFAPSTISIIQYYYYNLLMYDRLLKTSVTQLTNGNVKVELHNDSDMSVCLSVYLPVHLSVCLLVISG